VTVASPGEAPLHRLPGAAWCMRRAGLPRRRTFGRGDGACFKGLVAVSVLLGSASCGWSSVAVPRVRPTGVPVRTRSSFAPSDAAAVVGASPAATDIVRVHVPRWHTAVGVVILHSAGHGIAEPIEQGWSASSDRHGFVAIYPSQGPDWNAGLCCGPASRKNRADVAWLINVIARAKSRYGLDTIYLAGNSNGGMMVERLVAEHPGITRRFAVWAAAPEMRTGGIWNGDGLLARGTADKVVPATGGRVRIVGLMTYIRPVSSTGQWLRGGHFVSLVVQGRGHGTPPNWPETAWSFLNS
jgi:poly(3-hydroxybutyrate) depolymerase